MNKQCGKRVQEAKEQVKKCKKIKSKNIKNTNVKCKEDTNKYKCTKR